MTIEIEGGSDLLGLEQAILDSYTEALRRSLEETVDLLRARSPRGVSPRSRSLAESYQYYLVGRGFPDGAIENNVEGARFRLAGRGPGGFPPFHEGSDLYQWAQAVGIPAFLVARKQAEEGSDRWKSGNNVLGLSGDGDVDQNSEAIRSFEESLEGKMDSLEL